MIWAQSYRGQLMALRALNVVRARWHIDRRARQRRRSTLGDGDLGEAVIHQVIRKRPRAEVRQVDASALLRQTSDQRSVAVARIVVVSHVNGVSSNTTAIFTGPAARVSGSVTLPFCASSKGTGPRSVTFPSAANT